MKKLILILLFMLAFTLPVKAESLYSEQFGASGAGEIKNFLTDDATEILEDMEIDPSSPEWVNGLDAENVFSKIISFFKKGAKTPLKAGFTMLAFLLVTAAAGTFEGLRLHEDTVSYVFALASAAILLSPIVSFVSVCGSAIKGITTLMTGFIPVFAGILTASGKGLTASGMSFMLLSATSAVSNIASFVVLPLMNCYLGVGLAGSVAPIGGLNRLGDGIKKTALWSLSLILTLFIGILSVQTGVNRAADGLGVKTAKFMIGSFVPVAGGALSESLTTLLGSLNLLKTSFGMFGAVAVAVTVLPVLIELIIWRMVIYGLTVTAEALGVKNRLDILTSVDSVLAALLGILLFTAALFIISLAVVSGGGNG